MISLNAKLDKTESLEELKRHLTLYKKSIRRQVFQQVLLVKMMETGMRVLS